MHCTDLVIMENSQSNWQK